MVVVIKEDGKRKEGKRRKNGRRGEMNLGDGFRVDTEEERKEGGHGSREGGRAGMVECPARQKGP